MTRHTPCTHVPKDHISNICAAHQYDICGLTNYFNILQASGDFALATSSGCSPIMNDSTSAILPALCCKPKARPTISFMAIGEVSVMLKGARSTGSTGNQLKQKALLRDSCVFKLASKLKRVSSTGLCSCLGRIDAIRGCMPTNLSAHATHIMPVSNSA